MKDGQHQIKQNQQKQDFDEELISALEQQIQTKKCQALNDTQQPEISEHLSTYQLYAVNLSNISLEKHKNQIVSPNNQKSLNTIFKDLWQKYKFNPTKFCTSLTANSIKYEPCSKPFFPQNFFVSKSSQHGNFFTLNLSISTFVMKLYILMEQNFIIPDQIFEEWQSKQLKYLDSGSFSDIFEYYDPKGKEIIVIKKINFSKAMQVSIQSVVYEYAFLKLAGALGIGLEIRPIFGFDLLFRKHYVLFGMQRGYKSYLESIDQQKLSSNILGSLILLHSLNIAHCDIRPQNIQYSNRLDKYVLIDYGLSQSLDQGLGYKNLISNFKGTYHYSSVQMQKLFFSQNKYVDMYFNDIHCLKKTIEEEIGKYQSQNFEVKFSISEKMSHLNADRSIYIRKYQQKPIVDCLLFLNHQPKKPEICILRVLQTAFYIYKMDRQMLQTYLKILNEEQISLVIKIFSDLEIDYQYHNLYTHFLKTIKVSNFKSLIIENQLNKIKNKTYSQKTQQGKATLLFIEKLEKSHFYLNNTRSYLIQLWNFYQSNILQDFLYSCQFQKSFSCFSFNQPIQKQDYNLEEKILKRKYKELKQINLSRIFFMFLKEMQRYQRNRRLQTILISQFCLHYLQILTSMWRKLQLNSFVEQQRNIIDQFQIFPSEQNNINKIICFFYKVKKICQELIVLNEEINYNFFDRTNLKKQNENLFNKEDDLRSSLTDSSIPTITQITTQKLAKMLKPPTEMMNENQIKVSTEVHKIFIRLFNMYIELTTLQVQFNLQYYMKPSFQPPSYESNSQITKPHNQYFSGIQFRIFHLNRSRKSLIFMVLILFVLAKIFYQGSAFLFQQKYILSISIVKNCTDIVTLFIQSHYNMIAKLEENHHDSTKKQINQDFFDFGGFKKFEEKIIQCIQYLFESYSMIFEFIIEQDLQNINCVIGQNIGSKQDKMQIYRQFKTFYEIACSNIKFYNIFKKESKNQPGVTFADEDSEFSLKFDSKQTFSLLDSYFQEFHSNGQHEKQVGEKQHFRNRSKYRVCLSTFYNSRFILVCQEITLFLQSLELKIKTNLKFPLQQKQFYELFKKIQRLQNYDRKEEQKLCVILRYVDYLFLQQKNICSAIQVLEEINECINRRQLAQIDDRFFNLHSKSQKTRSSEQKSCKMEMGRKKGSFNYLVIKENLQRVYNFMKSSKLKAIKMPLQNIKEKRDSESDKDNSINFQDRLQKARDVTFFSLRQIIDSINTMQIQFKNEFKQHLKQITAVREVENQSIKSSSIVNTLKQIVVNILCRIKYQLNKLYDLPEEKRKNSPQSRIRSFLEQSFQLLAFLNFNSELVMEHLWSILSRIRKKTQIIGKVEQEQINNLKQLTKFILNIYLTQCATFSTQVNQRCNSNNDISQLSKLNHIQKNDHCRWLKLKYITERKSQLIQRVFTLGIVQNQSDWLQHLTMVNNDQDNQQMTDYYIDFLYYAIKYSPQSHIITNSFYSISPHFLILSKIVNYLLSYQLHLILSSKKEYVIFAHYLRVKLILIHQIHKNHHHTANQIQQSNQKSLLIFDVISLIYKLTQFLTSIQSLPYTFAFIQLVKDIASTSGFTIFLLQLIQILLYNSTSIHQRKIFIYHDLFNFHLKNDMYFLTFCFQGILDCQNLQNLIKDSLIYKNKMTNEEINIIKSIFSFFKLFASALQFKFNFSHQSLKKYLIQKRQIYKYFLITSLHGKFFNFIKQNNQIQPRYQLRSCKKSKDRKRIIINSFRKIKQYHLYLEIEQRINIKMQRLDEYNINEKLIKFLTMKLEHKHKQWQHNLTE